VREVEHEELAATAACSGGWEDMDAWAQSE
jgi:hypothetical protein